MKPLWALRVHSFDSKAVLQSLEGQLLLLRTLARQPAGLSLTWRLTVEPARDDRGVSADLSLICFSTTSEDKLTMRAAELANLASVVLAAGHGLSLDRAPAQRPLPSSGRFLAPTTPRPMLPVKSDWAILVDLLRHRGEKIVVNIDCRPAAHSCRRSYPSFAPPLPPTSSTDPGVRFLSELTPPNDESSLEIEVSVHTPSPADDILLTAISQLTLGIPTVPVTHRNRRQSVLEVSPEEALRTWHSPYGKLQGRGLTPSPPNLSAGRDLSQVDGVVIGSTSVQGPDWDRSLPLRLANEERLRHVYVIGKTGVGKTNLLKNIAQQDIERGAGVAVLSPHADLIDHLLAIVGDRHEEVTYLDFGHPTHLPVLNPLSMDIENSRMFSANSARVVELFTKRTFNQFVGPVFTDIMRLAIDSIAALVPLTGPEPTLVAAVELVRSDKLQRWASKTLKDQRPDLAEEWERVFNVRGSEAAETSRWVTAKFSDLGSHSALRAITSGLDPSPFSIRDIYRQGKILLVKLPETRMPSVSSSLLGSLLFSSIYREAKLMDTGAAKPFYLHVDEFQRFVTGDLEELVAEARKFKLGLTFAHQNLRQLEAFSMFEGSTNSRLAEAIFSNVGTIVAMKTSGRDVAPISQELSVPEPMIRGLVRGQAVVRTSYEAEDIVCTVKVPLSETSGSDVSQLIEKRMVRDGIWLSAEDQDRRVEDMLSGMRSHASVKTNATSSKTKLSNASARSSEGGSFLDDWLAKRKQDAEPESINSTSQTLLSKKGKAVNMDQNGDTA